MNVLRSCLGIVLAALTGLAALAAETPPDQLIKSVAEEVRSMIKEDKDLQGGNHSKIGALVEEKLLPHINFPRTTQLAVGKGWRQASAEQKEKLIKEFRALLVRTYAVSLSQFRDQVIEYRPVKLQSTETEVVVHTQVIQSGREAVDVDYTMHKTADGWKVFDITVGGVSLVTTYRSEFNERIRQSGIDGLIKALSEKNRAGS